MEQSELRKSRLALAYAIEPWATNYLLTIRDSANLSTTYGAAGEARTALDALAKLRADNALQFTTRSVEIATLFGADALEAYTSIHTATVQLEHCLEVTHFRSTAYPTESPFSGEREALRMQCSKRLQELDLGRTKLLAAMARRLVSSSGDGVAIAKPLPFQWVRVSIEVNGMNDIVILRNAESFSFSWASPDAAICQISTPSGVSGISRVGSDGPVPPEHPWYPKVAGGTLELRLDCTNGWATSSDAVTITRES
jgi:hypothetical protein